ncbi:ATP synthase subunit I [Geovibrio thiophilus]|uniref:ATP synthase subunit I n=1 Tax=Geovibrio thiophilus TaxID=139438 RepID=A0A3R5X1R1_9BACT|nr:ATP synthase subunit I [Geovibrio thiophilus]QAR32361.1 ATP synthase subunit I [Geovibrio thiophilus]
MKITNKIIILSLIFSAILYTVCTIFFDKSFTIGVLCGYLLAVLNFFMLSRNIRNAFEGQIFRAVAFNTQVRLLGTGAAVWAAYEYLHAGMIGILVGISVVPLCILLVAVYHYRSENDDTSDGCGGSA